MHHPYKLLNKMLIIKCVIHTSKACVTLTKTIISFEAGYSSKTVAQQLALSGVGNFWISKVNVF